MELHTRVALIDTLLEEADQKMQALYHALAAQERAKKDSTPDMTRLSRKRERPCSMSKTYGNGCARA